jgi:SAM-dependent methyltransferase
VKSLLALLATILNLGGLVRAADAVRAATAYSSRNYNFCADYTGQAPIRPAGDCGGLAALGESDRIDDSEPPRLLKPGGQIGSSRGIWPHLAAIEQDMDHYSLRPKSSTCPVCSSRQGLILYSVDAAQAAQHYILREVDQERHDALRGHIESQWAQPTCDVVRCGSCGFVFADPFVAGDARFYELAYQRTGYPKWKWEFQQTRDALAALQADGQLGEFQLLEIGAGNGAFVKRIAPSLTPKENVLCTEFSEYGRDAIEQYGIRCVSQDVRSLPRDEFSGRFDVICMFQVLEHVDRLDELFQQLAAISRSTGHLFIGVPNDRRIEFNELHGSLLDMPPNHVGRWNRTAFEHIARRHGWRIADFASEREPAMNKVRQFAAYRYGRKSQDRRSLANRVNRLAVGRLKRGLQAVVAGGYLALALPQLIALVSGADLGDAQWVHLTKAAAGPAS